MAGEVDYHAYKVIGGKPVVDYNCGSSCTGCHPEKEVKEDCGIGFDTPCDRCGLIKKSTMKYNSTRIPYYELDLCSDCRPIVWDDERKPQPVSWSVCHEYYNHTKLKPPGNPPEYIFSTV